MGDAASHLPQGPEPFLLHHSMVRLAQVIICMLQSPVHLSLMSSQGDVFRQLSQKLAVAAAETVGLPTSRDQHTEDLALEPQRRRH